MTDTVKTYQWTGVWSRTVNGIAINENITLRHDDKQQLLDDRVAFLDLLAPAARTFPNDEGEQAHVQTTEAAPICVIHHTAMTLKPAGISKSGRKYPAFWTCGTLLPDGTWCAFRGPKPTV